MPLRLGRVPGTGSLRPPKRPPSPLLGEKLFSEAVYDASLCGQAAEQSTPLIGSVNTITPNQRAVLACEVMRGQLTTAGNPAEYIAQLAEPRRSEVAALDALIRKTAPKLAPFIHSGMLAYGPWRFKYPSGREGDWFRIGVASNKNYISLYICATDEKGYIAERYKQQLPKANIGRSCVRFNRLSDLDQAALKKMIREGAKL